MRHKVKLYKFHVVGSMAEEKMHILECHPTGEVSDVQDAPTSSDDSELLNCILVRFLSESDVISMFARFMQTVWVQRKCSEAELRNFVKEYPIVNPVKQLT